MKNMTLVLLLLILVTISTPALAVTWVKVDEDTDLDTDSIKVDGEYVEYISYDIWTEAEYYWVSDCTRFRLRLLKTVYPSTYALSGPEYPKKTEWRPIDRNADLKAQHEYVCKHYYRR